MALPRIYLMPDYTSSSLWTDEPEHGMVSLDDLPLEAGTKADLEAWSAQLFTFLEEGLRDESKPDADADAAFEAEGLRLWAVVREQLAGRFEVGYATFVAAPTDEDPDEQRKLIVWAPEERP